MGSRRKLWSGELSSSPNYPGNSLQKIKLTGPAPLILILGSVKPHVASFPACLFTSWTTGYGTISLDFLKRQLITLRP